MKQPVEHLMKNQEEQDQVDQSNDSLVPGTILGRKVKHQQTRK